MQPETLELFRTLTQAMQVFQPGAETSIPGMVHNRKAGVLVPLLLLPDPVVLVTVRALTLPRHAGEISFPGGKPEPGDEDLQATALREAGEELGLLPAELAEVHVLGRLSSIPLYGSEYRMYPYLGVWLKPLTLNPCLNEVEEVLSIRLLEVLERPAISSLAIQVEGGVLDSPVFELEDRILYGGTAYSLLELLGVLAPLLGRRVPPFDRGRYTWEELLARRGSRKG